MSGSGCDNKLVVDIDGTLCPIKKKNESYKDLKPCSQMVEKLKDWRAKGFKIVLFTARNMRTFNGQIGEINKHTAPVLLDWLDRHGIEYDEIIFGKPWPGPKGFYIDDRTVRPSEFLEKTEEELYQLLKEQGGQR